MVVIFKHICLLLFQIQAALVFAQLAFSVTIIKSALDGILNLQGIQTLSSMSLQNFQSPISSHHSKGNVLTLIIVCLLTVQVKKCNNSTKKVPCLNFCIMFLKV
jgi:hypothetical protein